MRKKVKKYQFGNPATDIPSSQYKQIDGQWYQLVNGTYQPVSVNPQGDSGFDSANGKDVSFQNYNGQAITDGANLDGDNEWRKNQITEKTNTPLGYNKTFTGLNNILDLTQFVAGNIDEYRRQKDERNKINKARYNTSQYNYDEKGLNNVPIYFKTGGKYMPKMKGGGGEEDYKGYYQDYMNSPRYKAMLGDNPEIQSKREEQLANFPSINIVPNNFFETAPTKGQGVAAGRYDEKNNSININKELPQGKRNGVIIHEGSHQNDAGGKYIPQQDVIQMNNYKDGVPTDIPLVDYLKQPTEVRARLNQLRYKGKQNKVFDPFTEEFKPEYLDKFKNSQELQDLRKIYTDEQITNLMNSVSDNNSPETTTAKNGGRTGGYKQDHRMNKYMEQQMRDMMLNPFIHKQIFAKFATGGTPEVTGVPNSQANAELEKGEVFQNQQGGIQKVAESEPTHEDGGSNQAMVHRVLEDTSDKRADKASRLLKISPEESKLLVGFKPKSSVTHSKLYEMATEFYDKHLKKAEKVVKSNLEYVKNQNGGKFAQNSLEENLKQMAKIPTPGDIFDAIYNHQQLLKENNSIGEYADQKQYGGKAKRKYALGGDPNDVLIDNTNSQKYKRKELLDWGYTDEEIDGLVKKGDFSRTPMINRAGKMTSIQTGTPAIETAPITDENGMPVFNKPTGVEASKFNEPLQWYDTASNVMNYLSSLTREQVPLEQLQRDYIRVREQNPLPTLLQNQGDYNAALKQLPTNGVGFANQANLQAGKYKANNEVLGQYENINKQGQTGADQYNEQAKFQLDNLNLGLRDQYSTRVLQSREIQRVSKLNALDDLFTKIAQNRALNRNGDLVMQLTPYFDQYGKFNGNKYTLNIGTGSQAQIVDKTTGKVVKVIDKTNLDKSGNLKGTSRTTISTPSGN